MFRSIEKGIGRAGRQVKQEETERTEKNYEFEILKGREQDWRMIAESAYVAKVRKAIEDEDENDDEDEGMNKFKADLKRFGKMAFVRAADFLSAECRMRNAEHEPER